MPGEHEQGPRRGSVTSIRTDTTWRYSVFGPERLGRGAVLFTGPDGIRDHRVDVSPHHHYIGEGTMSPEGTSEMAYLWRAPYRMPHPHPKSRCVGEVGWGIPDFSDRQPARSGQQITLGEFRRAAEDRHTHLLLNAWYPSPAERRAYTATDGYTPSYVTVDSAAENTGGSYTQPSLESQQSLPIPTVGSANNLQQTDPQD